MSESDPLSEFLEPVRAWFRSVHGTPSPPQCLGWPSIRSGQHTLILAPTGSGKTLASFLACLDLLWREPGGGEGVRILYVSPLKALNEDIARNLEAPLAGIVGVSRGLGKPLRPLRHAVRTGDTPASQRQAIARRPPEILITTPESLHLLLGSRTRSILRSVSHVIVDEIHALCPNKRGVFLSILLERLEEWTERPFVRIGLSATQRPLGEVARFLGGQEKVSEPGQPIRWRPRPVQIIDTGMRKEMDLEVSFPPAERTGEALQGSVWPGIESRLLDLIRGHRSTIVFANNRRLVERLTNRLNDRVEAEAAEAGAGPEVGVERVGAALLVRSHHGSLSLEQRRETEQALKEGRLGAVVATASLELGIDMGAVELVCQVESPGSVSRGLQRVGRAGHLVGQSSQGRLFAKTRGDLLETAALARAMLRGEVEPLRVPSACLDLLAQQIVASVAVGPREVGGLYELFRRCYAYRDLRAEDFERVLGLVSGRHGLDHFRDLRPRISWDRVHNRLEPLPGSSSLALLGGGAIPDTGQYAVVMGEGGPRLGELDEEFVLERRVGDVFVLGTSTWRIEAIEPDRVVVSPATNPSALIPFWRGEGTVRTVELGLEVGRLTRLIAERKDDPDLLPLLMREYRLDAEAASALVRYIRRQLGHSGFAPDDRTIVVESFRDPAGECLVAVLSPFGRRFHQALRLIGVARLEAQLGLTPASISSDDGVLFRLPGSDSPPLDLFDGLDPDRAEQWLGQQVMDSPGFGLRFRQNAVRALLMPRPRPGKRSPLWLQRLRAKDLLQVVRQVPDFPIVTETLRECLLEDLDLPGFRRLAAGMASGEIRVVKYQGETPSPFASELVLPFTSKFLYEWDEPRRPPAPSARPEANQGEALSALLDPVLRRLAVEGEGAAEAAEQVDRRLRGLLHPPRTPAEAAEWLRRLGDLLPGELPPESLPHFEALQEEGRLRRISLGKAGFSDRLVLTEMIREYEEAFGEEQVGSPLRGEIVRRFLRTRAFVGLDELLRRYPIGRAEALEYLEAWVERGEVLPVGAPDDPASHWADVQILSAVRRQTLTQQRRETRAVEPEVFSRFVVNRQHLRAASRLDGEEGVEQLLALMRGHAAPGEAWETDLLPRRMKGYRSELLDRVLGQGGWSWRPIAGSRPVPLVAFLERGFPLDPPTGVEVEESDQPLLDLLRRRGASFVADLAVELSSRPLAIHAGLDRLMARGLVANDRFDPVRPSGRARWKALEEAAGSVSARRGGRRRPERGIEGRWFALEPGDRPREEVLSNWSRALLVRYGIVSREIVGLELAAPPWRELISWLDRAEWRGEVKRGYFVEGLSGLQYASPEAPEQLLHLAESVPALVEEAVLIASVDPANLFGTSAPYDLPLLGGGSVRLPRNESTYLVLASGRPVLIAEGNGKRLTTLAGATEEELSQAFGLLRTLAHPDRRVLKVEAVDGQPAWNSPQASRLAEAGFVRDPPGMALYVGW